MIDLSLHEAQLFRICSAFFGEERVLLKMGVLTVCGGDLPEGRLQSYGPSANHYNGDLSKKAPKGQDELNRAALLNWAKGNNCLITVVDGDDQPKLVIEFFSGFEGGIDVVELEHQRYLKPILEAAGIQYLTISMDEFREILNPESSLDFVGWLKANLLPDEPEPETDGHV